MMLEDFNCKQCGSCCLNLDGYQTTCSGRDVRRWEKQKRYDILEWVCSVQVGKTKYEHHIWINSRTDMEVDRCPWLRKLPGKNKYICRINDVKPERCKFWYPDSKAHAAEIGCRGFEKRKK